jgi:hypothetical protein
MKFFNTPFVSYAYDLSQQGGWPDSYKIIYVNIDIPRRVYIEPVKGVAYGFGYVSSEMNHFFSTSLMLFKSKSVVVSDDSDDNMHHFSHYLVHNKMIMQQYEKIIEYLY